MRNLKILRVVFSLKLSLILAVCVAVFASISSSKDAPFQQCPKVKVSCSRNRKASKDVKFEAKLQNARPNLPVSFDWTLSAGAKTHQSDEGGKSVITVDARGVAGGDITATVTVSNAGPNCNPTDSCTTHISGTPPLNAPPTISSMVASASSIVICPKDPRRSEPTTIQLTVAVFDPDNDELIYSWTTTGGRIEGGGGSVRWNLAGVEPGTYSATVTVSDGRTEVTATTSIEIKTCK